MPPSPRTNCPCQKVRQAITTGGTEAQDLLRQADAAIDAGQIAEAKKLLAQVTALRDEQRKMREQLREELDKADLDDAAVDERAANISLTELDSMNASQLFLMAAEKVPSTHWQERGDYLLRSADALVWYGDRIHYIELTPRYLSVCMALSRSNIHLTSRM